MAKVLWKEDKIDGIIYVCPSCKAYVCGFKICDKCNEPLEHEGHKDEYKGKVKF